MPFHLGQDFDERHLDFMKQTRKLQRLELRLEHRTQTPCDVGVLARVVTGAVDRYLIERDDVLSLAAEIFEARHLVIEKLERQEIDPVGTTARIEHVARDHRVEVEAANRHAGDA